ncbi:MAG: sigma-70 family RNA polymerase sigma factor, partial [Planctomycetes bacterium]|nr:sigma-70 family RNA polymerase sigma factor [Planctomycetota bacterium]
MHPLTEDQLFARFQDGRRPDDLAAVFDATAPPLLRLARHLAGPGASAEDLVQATFLAAIEGAARWDPTRGVFAWLVGILVRQAHVARRRGQRTPDPRRLPSTPAPAAAELAERNETAASVAAAIDGLDEPFRAVVHLHLGQGLGSAEIAARLARPAGTVRTQLARGLQRLRIALPVGLGIAVAPATGLAAVRTSVLAAGAAAASAGPTAAFSGAWMAGLAAPRALAVLAAVAIAALAVWLAWPSPPMQVPAVESPTPTTVAEAGPAAVPAPRTEAADAAGPERREAPAPAAATATPGARGSLLVTVTFVGHGIPAGTVAPGIALLASRTGMGPPSPQSTMRATTDATGIARFADLDPGTLYVGFGASQPGVLDLQPLEIAAGAPTRLSLALAPTHDCRLRVVDETGAPIQGAAVTLRLHGPFDRPRLVGHSDADGRCRLLAVGERFVSVAATGFATSASLPLPPAGTELAVQLSRAIGRLRVLVRCGGSPLPHANVVVDGMQRAGIEVRPGVPQPAPPSSATTDVHGETKFADVASGWHRVTARAPGIVAGSKEVEVQTAAETAITIDLHPPGELFGRVTVDGVPTRGLFVLVGSYLPFAVMGQARSGDDGSYRIGGMPADPVDVLVQTEDLRRMVRARVHLTPGERRRLDLDLIQPPPFRGRVVDGDGRGIAGWHVTATEDDGRSFATRATSGDDGAFELPGTGGSTSTLRVYPSAGDDSVAAASLPHVAAGATGVELRLAAGRAFAVRGR